MSCARGLRHTDEEAIDVPGHTQSKDQHLARLRRIEGQIRGLQRMVEEDTRAIERLLRA